MEIQLSAQQLREVSDKFSDIQSYASSAEHLAERLSQVDQKEALRVRLQAIINKTTELQQLLQ